MVPFKEALCALVYISPQGSPCLDSSEDILDDSISNPQTSLSYCAPRSKWGKTLRFPRPKKFTEISQYLGRL